MKLALVCPTALANPLGRAYALWLLADHLGWDTRILVPDLSSVWTPLAAEEPFTRLLTTDGEGTAAWADVFLAQKPWPGGYDRALALARPRGTPLVLDVDDPDWEAKYGATRPEQARRILRGLLRGRFPWRAYRLRALTSRAHAIIVSNPGMHRWYPGIVVPHARRERPPGAAHERSADLRVVFVGTVRPHKGIDALRGAVSDAGDMTLTVTAPPPSDAAPHETWLGETSLARGLETIDAGDVFALPSHPDVLSLGQLPVKLLDAMISGRAIVASDLPPIRWALGEAGLLVPPGDAGALADALRHLRSPDVRRDLGARARERALTRFTPEAVAPALVEAVALARRRAANTPASAAPSTG